MNGLPASRNIQNQETWKGVWTEVQAAVATGTTVQDANGNKIEMTASGVSVKASATVTVEGSAVMLGGQGGEPVIKGTSFLTLFATHIHPTGMGPSGPPIPQGEMSSLSSKVMSS